MPDMELTQLSVPSRAVSAHRKPVLFKWKCRGKKVKRVAPAQTGEGEKRKGLRTEQSRSWACVRQQNPAFRGACSPGNLFLVKKSKNTYCVPGSELRTSQPLMVNAYASPGADMGQVSIWLWHSWVFLDNQKKVYFPDSFAAGKELFSESQTGRSEQK